MNDLLKLAIEGHGRTARPEELNSFLPNEQRCHSDVRRR
jgi:hypothetical protein